MKMDVEIILETLHDNGGQSWGLSVATDLVSGPLISV